jgi:hypothetical protein
MTTNSAGTPRHAVASPLDGVRSVPADGNMPHGPAPQPGVPATPGAANPGASNPRPNTRPAAVDGQGMPTVRR